MASQTSGRKLPFCLLSLLFGHLGFLAPLSSSISIYSSVFLIAPCLMHTSASLAMDQIVRGRCLQKSLTIHHAIPTRQQRRDKQHRRRGGCSCGRRGGGGRRWCGGRVGRGGCDGVGKGASVNAQGSGSCSAQKAQGHDENVTALQAAPVAQCAQGGEGGDLFHQCAS
jgi:hypothetical protein